MRVLQTLALPLGYRAVRKVYSHSTVPRRPKSNGGQARRTTLQSISLCRSFGRGGLAVQQVRHTGEKIGVFQHVKEAPAAVLAAVAFRSLRVLGRRHRALLI